MTRKPTMFTNIDEDEDSEKVTFGDNSKVRVRVSGKVTIMDEHHLSKVFLVETPNFNLLSIGQLCDMGFKCMFDEDVTKIENEKKGLVFHEVRHKNLYVMDFKSNNMPPSTCLFTKASKGWL